MTKQRWELKDEQWRKIEPLLPKQHIARCAGWGEGRDFFLHGLTPVAML